MFRVCLCVVYNYRVLVNGFIWNELRCVFVVVVGILVVVFCELIKFDIVIGIIGEGLCKVDLDVGLVNWV